MSVAIKEKVERDTARSLERARRPRILHLINSFEIGGTERQAVELLKRLDSNRYDVQVAALRNQGPFYDEIASRFSNVPEFPLTSFYNLNAIKQLRKLVKLMKQERIDLLHAHDFYSGIIGAAAARLAGAKAIASQRHLKLSDRKVHAVGHRIIYRLAHRILVNSEAIRDFMVKECNAPARKIVVIRNGIAPIQSATDTNSDSRFDSFDGTSRALTREAHDNLCRELNIDLNAKLVGTIARLQPVKGHRFLIEAASRVIAVEPEAHFVIVGDGPLREEIENQVKQLGIQSHVHLMGDRADASQLVSAFDVTVLASLHEGLPNAVMEAMVAGVPVVATGVGGTQELITDGETGYLVAPADSDAMAARIAFVLSNPNESIVIAARAFELVMSRFSIKRMVESVEKLYDEMMSETER